jgi:uncharacterized membrane protein
MVKIPYKPIHVTPVSDYTLNIGGQMRFGPILTKWLKCFHLLTVIGWVGGVISLSVLHFLRFKASGIGADLHGIDRAAHLIDWAVVVSLGAIGVFLTGLLYSWCTNWGFFRHKWIIAKWIILLFCTISGLYLGSWEETMGAISQQLGSAALQDPRYISSMYLNFWLGSIQVVLLIFAMCLSVFKPWKPKK